MPADRVNIAGTIPALACALWLATAAVPVRAQTAPAPAQQAPVEARIPWAPAAVAATDGRAHLAYELHLSNFYAATGALRIVRLEVYADAAQAPLARFEGEALLRLGKTSGDETAQTPRKDIAIDGGQRTVLFVWLDLAQDAPTPKTLRHRIEFVDARGARTWIDGAAVALSTTPPVRLGPPLAGGTWLAYEGPSNAQSHHWGSVVAANGEATIPQRYALDLIGLDRAGRAVRAGAGELAKTRHRDWVGYGAPVLAVADGTVRAARDGEPERAPLAPQPEPAALSADDLYGNYVILEIAPQVFVHYAHLQPGSVAAKAGERVRRGQALGRLGQSGNAGGPHLHLHVSNAATFEQSEGLPFVFERFDMLGRRSIGEALAPDSPFAPAPQTRRAQMPLDGDAIGFDPPR
ncbi:M23 family metallopeptidase [Lysobacter enzymogenes]|uniref:M23 family metallopeptidase n=1 Tax=Lysobacter enzymogenes TaxID=69 RepID=UPI001A9599F8|nr:M23 family metallopeptidase [Lysobacter enzymogenes]QQP94301.1 peptidoglycan DD-metalloendopeptidase family protein [Lysobacter enzymogenes]